MSEVSVERLERALDFMAWFVETFGSPTGPNPGFGLLIYERLEKELEQARGKDATRSRIKERLEKKRPGANLTEAH